ncbi:type II toxin-antitoxin system HicB family antitoxin [Desulfosporosinus sp.]|uniref:type II toxin-antitoxin system HicB family antitoxin n=1 Tax=Desulfosporosinus sp. TaxID=157907 RepID=UPI0026074CF4|nr:type II toxin-antitoxin system HicB family antitoxin [Desulfosporosinus sp.]MCO5386578.1 type II toxin-antitoxin system HicB family antitoxin [Desulfosporosinus sp.]
MVYVFPAIFTPVENGYAIRFPDLPGTNSQGNDLANAIYMARDALASWLDYLIDENEVIPNPSMTNNIPLDDGQFVTMIDKDMTAYRRHKNSKAVKKTLSIPSWLNEEAEAHNVNFSSILQEALKEHLGIQANQK